MNSNATFTIVSTSTRVLVAAGSALITLVLFTAVLTIADTHEAEVDIAACAPAASPVSVS
jgi:hypothetical protein